MIPVAVVVLELVIEAGKAAEEHAPDPTPLGRKVEVTNTKLAPPPDPSTGSVVEVVASTLVVPSATTSALNPVTGTGENCAFASWETNAHKMKIEITNSHLNAGSILEQAKEAMFADLAGVNFCILYLFIC